MIRSFFYNTFSWLHTTLSEQLQSTLLAVIASGPIPQHVAFVMDGNRRYARSRHQEIFQGHAQGFEALRRVRDDLRVDRKDVLKGYGQVLEICMRLNIHCVTVYAFAIENFKRTPEEVNALMSLAEDRLVELAQHGYVYHIYSSSIPLTKTP